MWPLGENAKYLTPRWQLVRKRNLQANLQQQQHFKQMFQSIFLLPLQKVRKLESFMTSLYLNADHIFASQSRYPWTPIRRRRKSSENTSSSIIQVWFCLLSKYLNLFMILNLVLFPFGFIRYSIHLQLPRNLGRTLHWYRFSELAYEHILYISDSHPSACRPCTIWITWPAKHCDSELFIAIPRP